ncbi:hypothetical protein MRB53_032070 [Persea americana]|uniref:Uncharacterized protein n=1 Tax=Persea americana TaxID=3435 RepID=A0ACC2KRV1_PERAE|nr:hypothetical protein MRB53_032070 [Persea americana]
MDGREEAVPVTIDLDQFPAQAGKLAEACEALGCFRVVNHKIPLQLMSEMKSVVRNLFDLPTETKRRNIDTIISSGYVEPTPRFPLYEALGFYDSNSFEAVDAFCDQLDVTVHQRETIKTYAHEVHNLAMDIGHKIAQGLGVEKDLCREWPIQFKINKYSFTKKTVGSPGTQLHTDSGFLTVLQEDECVRGFQVMDKSSRLISVDPIPGSFLVNLGDVAKAWSNGRLCNAKHRVQCIEPGIRLTIAVFMLGPKEEMVEVPPELVDVDHPPLYLPFDYQDYRKRRISMGQVAGEALELYTIQNA